MIRLHKLDLNPLEKQSFRLHTIYTLLEGVILGVLALNEFVFLKSLKGSNLQLGVLFQFSTVVFVFLLFINEFIRRTKNRKRLVFMVGLLTPFTLVFSDPFSEIVNISGWKLAISLHIFGNFPGLLFREPRDLPNHQFFTEIELPP